MRPIDADALLTDRKKQVYYHLPNGDTAIPIIDIEHAPTVDAVPIIRCKNCKYAHMTYDGEVKYCDRISMPDDEGDYGYALYLPGDWFCAEGERKEGSK